MALNALFGGLIRDELGRAVDTTHISNKAHYVIDDAGFHRHIDAEYVDRQVMSFFLKQLQGNKEEAVSQTLKFLGKDDLFTKAAVDAQLKDINIEDLLAQGVPQQARQMLGMMGFKVIVNYQGDVIGMEQPSVPDDEY